MVNVISFTMRYALRIDNESFVDGYFDKKDDRRCRYAIDILMYDACVVEENLKGKGLGEDTQDIYKSKNTAVKRFESYRSPFINMFMPYISTMQMKHRFKHHICRIYDISTIDIDNHIVNQRSIDMSSNRSCSLR